MEINKSIMGFDWNEESEWLELKNQMGKLYDALTLYIESMAYLRSLNGVDITYGSAKTDAFFNIRTEKAWQEFMRDLYGTAIIEVDDNGPQEQARIVNETLGDYNCNSFYNVMREIHKILTSAGFNSNAHLEDYPSEEKLINIAESLLKRIVKLYPETNRKVFFVISLAGIPKKYAETMYDISNLPEFLNWNRITSWKNISEDWQIYSFNSEPWRSIAQTLKIMFGMNLEERWWNSSVEMWSILSKYTGENLLKRYIKDTKREVIRAYMQTGLSKHVSGVDEESFLFAEIVLKSIEEFNVENTVVADMGTGAINMENEDLIKFAAPQMFFGIGDLYLSEDSYWTLGLYVPEKIIKSNEKINSPVAKAKPKFMEERAIIHPNWEMHVLKNIIGNIDFYLRWAQEMKNR